MFAIFTKIVKYRSYLNGGNYLENYRSLHGPQMISNQEMSYWGRFIFINFTNSLEFYVNWWKIIISYIFSKSARFATLLLEQKWFVKKSDIRREINCAKNFYFVKPHRELSWINLEEKVIGNADINVKWM